MSRLAQAFADLDDITDVPALDETDEACFQEVREVLRKHGKLDRFALTLLHKHFEIYEGEVLVESCDKSQRMLTMQVMDQEKVQGAHVRETTWRLTDGADLQRCEIKCVDRGPAGHHTDHVVRR